LTAGGESWYDGGMKKILKVIAIISIGFLVIVLLAGYLFLSRSLPKTSGLLTVTGLRNEVIIKRDDFGVPFIAAQSLEDMYFATGYCHASDRLFQMDLLRRMSAGRLSEIFGDRALDLDKYHKELLVEETVDRLAAQIQPPLDSLMSGYCRGVNAYLGSRPLPPEFTLLGYRPEEWTIKDIFYIFKLMELALADSGSELTNLKTVQVLGAEVASRLLYGNAGSTIIDDAEYDRLRTNPSLDLALLGEMNRREQSIGSNNWVISGQKTISGRPLLANDPHLESLFPSYFYQVQAQAPEVELCGCTIPGTPFVVIGRNKHLGWGFTNIGTDVIDYFILQANPQDANQYRWQGEWRNFTFIDKKIKIKGKADFIHRVKLAVPGPVLQEGDLCLAEHSLMRYDSTVMDAFYRMNLAQNLEEFLAGLGEFSSPAQNVVFADTAGHIGYYPTGRVPKRSRGNGELPQPADKDEDLWQGFYPETDKPYLIDPEKGFIVTANNPVLPAHGRPIFSRTGIPSFRADRIAELITARATLDMNDMREFQTDCLLVAARFLVGKIKDFSYPAPGPGFVLEQLKNWDFKADRGICPFLFYRLEYHLSRQIFTDHLKNRADQGTISINWLYRILDYPQGNLDSPAFASFIDDITTPQPETFQEIVDRALTATYEDYRAQTAKGKVDWEKLHTVEYRHPLGSVALLKPMFNRGPYYMPGGRGSILTGSFSGSQDFRITHLSTFRLILDFSDFKNSLLINSTGQSGHLLSRHYDDQITLYTRLAYRPLEQLPPQPRQLRLMPGKPGEK